MKVNRQDVSEFGRRLRMLRQEHGLSMTAFCDQYNSKKGQRLSKGTVSRWENNTQEPMVSTVASVASFFGVSPMWMLGETDDRSFSATNISNSAVVQGNNATTLIVRNGKDAETLSEQEAELLRVFRGLGVKGQTRMLSFAYDLEGEEAAK